MKAGWAAVRMLSELAALQLSNLMAAVWCVLASSLSDMIIKSLFEQHSAQMGLGRSQKEL